MLLLWVACLGGCAGTYTKLSRESTVPELASLATAYAGLGNHTVLVPTGGGERPVVRVAVHAIGTPDPAKPTIVAVHGVFADHTMWRYLAADLARDHNLLLIDLPGCGESDCPDPDASPDDMYTPKDGAARTLEALEVFLGERGAEYPATQAVYLMGHSYGGAVILRMFGDEPLRAAHAGVLARVKQLLLLAPLDAAVEKVHPVLIELSRVSGVRIWTAVQLGLLRDRVAEGVWNSSNRRERALREDADAKVAILTNWERRRALQAMLQRAVPYEGDRPDWSHIDAIVASYAKVNVPTLIIWGVHDEVLPVSMGYKLAAELPDARLVAVVGGMHSLVQEEPIAVAWVIREYLAGHRPGVKVPPAAVVSPADAYPAR